MDMKALVTVNNVYNLCENILNPYSPPLILFKKSWYSIPLTVGALLMGIVILVFVCTEVVSNCHAQNKTYWSVMNNDSAVYLCQFYCFNGHFKTCESTEWKYFQTRWVLPGVGGQLHINFACQDFQAQLFSGSPPSMAPPALTRCEHCYEAQRREQLSPVGW